MGILLGLSPFIAFAVLSRFTSAAVALWVAAAVSVVLILRELKMGRSLKVLDCGTLTLFAGFGMLHNTGASILGHYGSQSRSGYGTVFDHADLPNHQAAIHVAVCA